MRKREIHFNGVIYKDFILRQIQYFSYTNKGRIQRRTNQDKFTKLLFTYNTRLSDTALDVKDATQGSSTRSASAAGTAAQSGLT